MARGVLQRFGRPGNVLVHVWLSHPPGPGSRRTAGSRSEASVAGAGPHRTRTVSFKESRRLAVCVFSGPTEGVASDCAPRAILRDAHLERPGHAHRFCDARVFAYDFSLFTRHLVEAADRLCNRILAASMGPCRWTVALDGRGIRGAVLASRLRVRTSRRSISGGG